MARVMVIRDTRTELIAAALELVVERGWDKTSVDAIVARARLSKGTFFHYFPTKDDILDAAGKKLASDWWLAIKGSFEGDDDPLEKLRCYLVAGRSHRVANASKLGELWEALEQDSNARLKAGIKARCRELVGPAMAKLVSMGDESGQFKVDDRETTTELILEFLEASADGTMRLLRNADAEAVGKACRRVNATLCAVERMLGIPDGTLERVDALTLRPFSKQPGPGTG